MSDHKPIELVVSSKGEIRGIYSPESDQLLRNIADQNSGEVSTRRASHVEPTEELREEALRWLHEKADSKLIGTPLYSEFVLATFREDWNRAFPGRWWADLTPVNGPVLGPYGPGDRDKALADEIEWLKANGIPFCEPCIRPAFPAPPETVLVETDGLGPTLMVLGRGTPQTSRDVGRPEFQHDVSPRLADRVLQTQRYLQQAEGAANAPLPIPPGFVSLGDGAFADCLVPEQSLKHLAYELTSTKPLNARYGQPDAEGKINCPRCGGSGTANGTFACFLCQGSKSIPAPPKGISYLLDGNPAWGFGGEGWYFWAEDEATCIGPWASAAEADAKGDEYAQYLENRPEPRVVRVVGDLDFAALEKRLLESGAVGDVVIVDSATGIDAADPAHMLPSIGYGHMAENIGRFLRIPPTHWPFKQPNPPLQHISPLPPEKQKLRKAFLNGAAPNPPPKRRGR